ncbi:uncharacterized protein APUU_31400S [Aspergillus puulaauensis]|uniref:Uncharacterized protein n=1 Tax=Aspergillus puulaauensis TaxID=1220207 RepID=A0A7R7XKR9_9EURO|nr:uncharacterized protein APUU_31400S [Aspergillus puulaauensis]BCS23175.1 hypothetical protein APUU_31400S [Aspergillus puulaauensis]
MVKLTPYFLREPQDLIMLPGYFLFAYFHSLIKLYAGLTFWETNWSGRNLDAINTDASVQDKRVSEKKSKPAIRSPRFERKLPFSPDTPIPSIESDADTMATPVSGRASTRKVEAAGVGNGSSGVTRGTAGPARRGRGRPRKS